MSTTVRTASGATFQARRVLGRHGGQRAGPLLVTVGGIHGNEPSGVLAAERVLARLERDRIELRGRYVALAGNLAALAAGARFVQSDLNRLWSPDALQLLEGADGGGPGTAEPASETVDRREQRELLETLVEEARGAWSPLLVLDLHSTSAQGPPFCIVGDTLQNRRIAFAFGVPVILGLEENVEGTLLGYVGERGHVAIGLEGGQHDDPATVDHHESAIWIALVEGGLLERERAPDLESHRARLARAAAGLPAVVELRHRQGIEPGEAFRMVDGYANFQRVARDELLAHLRPAGGSTELALRAPFRGILLLPRYQGQGQDGYFLGRRVRPFWLRVSAVLRRLRLERWLGLLPGVRVDREHPDALWVDRRVARFLSTQLFHLLGYRRIQREGARVRFLRRVEGPPR